MTNWIPLPTRRLLRLDGPDTIAFLERLVTNNTKNWMLGETRYGALLTPQGKVIADYLALRTETGIVLDVDAGIADDLLKRLTLFRLRSKIDISMVSSVCIAALPVGVAPPENALNVLEDIRFGDGRLRIVLQGECSKTDLSHYHAERVASAVPEQGEDFEAGEVFPSDINMDLSRGVDLKKGCFVGQEVVSRMYRRGKVRKRTVMIHGKDLEPGQDISAGSSLGEVTSIAGEVALARLRIDRLSRALREEQPLLAGSQPVEPELQDWLVQEMEALETA